MKKIVFFLLLIVNALNAQVGVNLSHAERGGTYIDMVKEGYRWQSMATNSNLTSDDVDAHGWPTIDAKFIQDFRPVAEWANSIDDPEVYRLDVSGTYKCSFTGQANIASVVDGSVENLSYDPNSNSSTFDFVVPQGSHGLFILEITDTKLTQTSATNTGFIDFKMLRPGYTNDDELFHQPLVDILNEINFSAIRYMDFTITNGRDPNYPELTTWANRKLPNDASQGRIGTLGKRGGSCWENVIELSNRTMTDPWINIPNSADDNYVIELARMFQQNLDPSLNIYVESSNEVWNTAPGFEQTSYNRLQAEALGIDERANHARRTVELSQLFEEVYGAEEINEKIRVILCSHKPMLKWWVQPMLEYVNENIGAPSDFIYGIACQTYFGGGIDGGESVDKILDDCHASITDQVNDLSNGEAGRIQWLQKARDWNLAGGYFSYEGGPDHGGGSTTNIANRILAERDERMCDMLKFNYDTSFTQIGANLAMQFTLTSAYTRFGCWGLTDDINHPYRNYKMDCLKEMLDITSSTDDINSTNFVQLTISPNPVLNDMNITFSVSERSHVRLVVYNNIGSEVAVLIDGKLEAGNHEEKISTNKLSRGMYFCKLYYDNEEMAIKKILLVN